MKKHIYISPLFISLLLSGCMITSEVSSLGGGAYSLSTLACPACGGTDKAERMALNAANKFCAEQGKEAVIENADIGSWSSNGAGTTDLIFLCVMPVSEDQVFACAQKHINAAAIQYGAEATETVLNKLFSDENGFGFAELSDHSYPTDIDQGIIKTIGVGYDECEDLRQSTASSSDKRVLQSAANRRMTIMAELSGSQITYGSYAKHSNEIDETFYSVLSDLEKETMRQRRAARELASERFNRAIQSTQPTNCVSTGSGNSVYTTCY
jgi:hypothetical protein